MKRLILFVFVMALLSACGTPNLWSVATIVPTETAIPIPTETLIPTSVPTYTIMPTETQLPTYTPVPTQIETIYILEIGDCMVDAPYIPPTVDPKTNYKCFLTSRRQTIAPFGAYGVKIIVGSDSTLDGMIEPYCALFTLDGTFISSDVDTTASNSVECMLP